MATVEVCQPMVTHLTMFRWMMNWYPPLLRVYEKQTGLKGHEQVIGGGTFGRLLKRGVAFGAMFPRLCQYYAPS